MKEKWLPVVGYEGYEVSNLGRARSLTRTLADGRQWKGRILALCNTRGGYKSVCIGRVPRRVNVLVLEAFKPPRLPGFDGAHIDGCRADNRLSNLAWKSKAENEADKSRHGTLLQADACPWSKLDSAKVRVIRERHERGQSYAQIARDLELGYQSVYDAGTGRRWKSV